MSQRTVKAASIQATPVFLDKKGSIEKYCAYIEEAGREGADLIVTPETGIPTYPYRRVGFGYNDPGSAQAWRDTVVAFYENAVRIPSQDTDQLCKAAKRYGHFPPGEHCGENEIEPRETQCNHRAS
jgi:nitrilase